jgi:hypothetical protein
MQTAPVAEVRPAVALLEKTPVLLQTLLGDLPSALLQWKPAPDRWSISEVLAHLAEIEQVYSVRAHAFHPHSGPFQKYSNPKP